LSLGWQEERLFEKMCDVRTHIGKVMANSQTRKFFVPSQFMKKSELKNGMPPSPRTHEVCKNTGFNEFATA